VASQLPQDEVNVNCLHFCSSSGAISMPCLQKFFSKEHAYKLQWRTWVLFSHSQFAPANETKAFATFPMHVLLQLAMAAASNRTTLRRVCRGKIDQSVQICPEAIVIFRPD